MLARISIRVRLTLAFAGAMALVLAAAGFFLSVNQARNIDASIDGGLRARADDVAALVAQSESGLAEAGRSRLTEAGENFAQVVDTRGSVVDATPFVRDRALLSPAELARARQSSLLLDRHAGRDAGERSRLLARSVAAQDQTFVVIVGASLEERDAAMRNLAVLLILGGPVALILACVAGYGVAAAALRPVEAMRRRAAEISGSEPGERLPVGAAGDELSRLGETLNEMLERIDGSLARERAFAADASHELRTPLAIVKTELELALRGEHTVDELRAAITSAGEETDRLAQLADDLLVIARSDQGGLPVHAAPLEVAALLQTVRERFARRAAAEGREIHVEAAAVATIMGDRLRLEQALGNLVENSLRHGGGAVRLSAVRRDGAVELHVVDQGPGIPPAFMPQAFERFSRPDSGRGRAGSRGSGLGLAIVRAIARAHGGDAHASNAEGGGADVWLSLPLVADEAQAS